MGPTKVIAPLVPNQLPPAPYVVAAHEILDDLYAETERLLREKEPAIHHLAKALIERDELIGDDLEEVFAEVEAAHPELKDKFERKIIPFRDFAPPDRQPGEGWAPQPAAAQEAAAEPAASAPDWSPPLPGSSRARYRRADGPGMPTDVIPPWANAPRH
jgi:hypothetical protein